ncbi:SDR family oxidoreductase [Agarivorans sp. B2Z047]|uniref:SDR family NAD(P)-dependent oxidoreductase n=1 Tax=Agarivorans sp. B2Z047 TaxID=2652721 RepID=UPI00128E02B5|nr:SDR family NAD(P)-dependent oxidoreductase [Agarivorans sp. B2Z047]MPW28668.1 SDR family oxidoreductase [Agarivorans sp. B2Z047]UQN41229.1 SDR family oxidoreductase [Agarivorans sp. B2Z047]
MTKDLVNKWVLISGASSGIGASCAKQYYHLGYSLLLVARDKAKLELLSDSLPSSNEQEVHYFSVDVSDELNVRTLFSQLVKITKRLDVLVNSAGVMLPQALIMTKPEVVEKLFKINSLSPVWLSQYASKLMMRQRKGAIINVGSAVAEQGAKGQSVYAASKAAVEGLTKSLARELAPVGIRVNAVRPGIIDTPLLNELSEEERESTINKVDLKRIGHPDEVAQVVVFLSQAEYVTGQIINVDGGLHL